VTFLRLRGTDPETPPLFAAISGSSIATVATMSKVAIPPMRRLGYDDRLSSGSVASGRAGGVDPAFATGDRITVGDAPLPQRRRPIIIVISWVSDSTKPCFA
jgi:Tripartite ATP-independent periplasmic transporter, DctM component